MQRKFGWSQKGVRGQRMRKYTGAQKINILSCIGYHGLVAFRILEANVTSADFNSFILDLVVPNIPEGATIVRITSI
jgi:hypothetical protein